MGAEWLLLYIINKGVDSWDLCWSQHHFSQPLYPWLGCECSFHLEGSCAHDAAASSSTNAVQVQLETTQLRLSSPPTESFTCVVIREKWWQCSFQLPSPSAALHYLTPAWHKKGQSLPAPQARSNEGQIQPVGYMLLTPGIDKRSNWAMQRWV